MESVSVGNGRGTTEEPLQVSGISPSTQPCATPTVSELECQMEAQERTKKLVATEDKLECMIYQKSQNDPTDAYCEWLFSELKNLSTESFEDF